MIATSIFSLLIFLTPFLGWEGLGGEGGMPILTVDLNHVDVFVSR